MSQQPHLKLLELEAENARLKKELLAATHKLQATEEKITKTESKVIKLQDEVLWLRRQLFGHKTERYIPTDPNQLKLDFEGLKLLPQEEELYNEAAQEVISYIRKKPAGEKKKPVRQPLPDHLERVDEVIEPQGVDLTNAIRIGEEITEVMEYIPGKIYVRRIIRPKYALPNDLGIRIANLPPLPLPKSNAGSSLLAELLVSKYMDHLPFHRQLDIFKRQNVHISASTVNDWFFSAVSLLSPLYEKLRCLILKSNYIGVDESTVPVIDNEKKKSIKAYLWIVRDINSNLVFFHYDKGSRSQKTMVNLLWGYQGAIQSDGYGAYNLYENKDGVLLLGCLAHCRRKFEESLKNDESRAAKALEQIGMLYAIERMADDQNLSFQERAALRQRLAYPILRTFERWLEENLSQVLPQSKIGKAIAYTYTIYRRLSRYVLDGRYRIDNNLVENTVRPLALGRKQYLFCQTHESAEMAAIMYSFMGCCKLHNVNPFEWLTDVLSRVDETGMNIEDLLPHKWKKKVNM